MNELPMVRHGAVAAHSHHGRLAAPPDLPLHHAIEEQARALQHYLRDRRFGRGLSSPLCEGPPDRGAGRT
jgi:probable phosphoglycerate mutase